MFIIKRHAGHEEKGVHSVAHESGLFLQPVYDASGPVLMRGNSKNVIALA